MIWSLVPQWLVPGNVCAPRPLVAYARNCTQRRHSGSRCGPRVTGAMATDLPVARRIDVGRALLPRRRISRTGNFAQLATVTAYPRPTTSCNSDLACHRRAHVLMEGGIPVDRAGAKAVKYPTPGKEHAAGWALSR